MVQSHSNIPKRVFIVLKPENINYVMKQKRKLKRLSVLTKTGPNATTGVNLVAAIIQHQSQHM